MKHDLSTFCVLPWLHRFTNVGGEIQVCCTSEEFDNNIKHEDGTPMKAPMDLNDEAIMNSQFMNNLRLQLLSGQWPSFCQRCESTEANNGISRRQVENQAYEEDVKALLENTNEDGSLKKIEIKSLDIRTGNQCNLACRMCNPRSSTKWINEWHEYHILPYRMSNDLKKEYLSYDWYKTDRMKSYFKAASSHITHLHFAGGEPLISKEMISFLEECVSSGKAKNISLSYNTNITRIDPKLKNLWPHFKGIKMLCSIDGYGKLNDIIRSPSKWEDIHNNLLYLEENFEHLNLEEVLVMCTVQAYNIFNLRDLYDYLYDNFKKIKPVPHLIDLYYPDYYQAQIFPPELKRIATVKLTEILDISYKRLDPKYHVHLETLKGTINFLNAENKTHLLRRFLYLAKQKDIKREEDIFKEVPELNLIKFESPSSNNALESAYFCGKPFKEIQIGEFGKIKPCQSFPQEVQHIDYSVVDLHHTSIRDAFEAQTYKELRTSILNSEAISECSVCYTQERSGHISERLVSKDKALKDPNLKQILSKSFFEFHESPIAAGSIVFNHPRTLKIGNHEVQTYGRIEGYNSQKTLRNLPNHSGLWDELKGLIPYLEEMTLLCGPSDHGLSATHFLRDMTVSGMAKRLDLTVNVGDINQFPEDIWSLPLSFKKLKIVIPLSGALESSSFYNDSAWDAIDKKISHLSSVTKGLDFAHLTISFNLSLLNYSSLERMLRWMDQNQFLFPAEKATPFEIYYLEKPSAISISHLPKNLRKDFLETITNLQATLSIFKTFPELTREMNALASKLKQDLAFDHPLRISELKKMMSPLHTDILKELNTLGSGIVSAIDENLKKYT